MTTEERLNAAREALATLERLRIVVFDWEDDGICRRIFDLARNVVAADRYHQPNRWQYHGGAKAETWPSGGPAPWPNGELAGGLITSSVPSWEGFDAYLKERLAADGYLVVDSF